MAIVKAPLFSLGATGKLGDTLVYSTWKGINTARIYTVPANPNTAAQVAQREILGAVVSFYQSSQTTETLKTSWRTAASMTKTPQSGFNYYASNAMKMAKAMGDVEETVDILLYAGATPQTMSLVATAASESTKPVIITDIEVTSGSISIEGKQLFAPTVYMNVSNPVYEPTTDMYYQIKLSYDGEIYSISGILFVEK